MPLKSRKGFGYCVRKACRGPSNVTIKNPLGNEVFTEAVLGNTGVGTAGEGIVIDKE